ncbi:unnamed protein product [Amoebophrya sp. A120]|nr:unnamed protein product [Amoebophrya sp. A120]|eukprot:GSA120T00002946001.1
MQGSSFSTAGAQRGPAESIAELQRYPDQIRNVCLIAHVDHGKTSLCDSLVATNGWISRKVAGSLRFLDSREDEQARMITMKSSAISLCYKYQALSTETTTSTPGSSSSTPRNNAGPPAKPKAEDNKGNSPSAPSAEGTSTTAPGIKNKTEDGKQKFLINVVDSPGHVDFTSEVSTATRLADGAIVLVDVVEGMSSQTREVLRQAWRDQLRTILVLNKMDRLFINLKLSADEAYLHVMKVIQQVNAAAAELLMADVLSKHDTSAQTSSSKQTTPAEIKSSQQENEHDQTSSSLDAAAQHALDFDEELEQRWTYHPAKGNVLFTSAMHGWGFSIQKFAHFMSRRMGCSANVLQKTLWGDFWYHPKERKVMRRKPTDGPEKRVMFAQMCLDTIFRFYQATGTFDNSDNAAVSGAGASQQQSTKDKNLPGSVDLPLLEKLCRPVPELAHVDLTKLRSGCVRELLGTWLPLGDCVLRAAVECLPGPREAAKYRIPFLLEYPLPAGLDRDGGVATLRGGGTSKVSGTRAAASYLSSAVSTLANKVGITTSANAEVDSATGAALAAALLHCDDDHGSGISTEVSSTTTAVEKNVPAVAYVTKYLGADLSRGVLLGDRLVHGNEESDFVGMCRVFAGCLKPGMLMMQATRRSVRGTSSSGNTKARNVDHQQGLIATPPEPTSTSATSCIAATDKGTTKHADAPAALSSEWKQDRVDAQAKIPQMATVSGMTSPLEIVSPSSRGSPAVLATPPDDWVVVPENKDPDEQDVGVDRAGGSSADSAGSEENNSTSVLLRDWTTLKVAKVYILMGSSLMPCEQAPAGSVVAISFENSRTAIHRTDRYLTLVQLTEDTRTRMRKFNHVLQQHNLATSSDGAAKKQANQKLELNGANWLPIFKSPYAARSFAIVKVSVETKLLEYRGFLERGLALLHRSDPSLDVATRASGENVIGCCGDEHLRRCLKDLQQLYLPPHVAISVSEPLVALRETITAPKPGFGSDLLTLPWQKASSRPGAAGAGDGATASSGSSSASASSYPVIKHVKDLLSFRMRAEKLPPPVDASDGTAAQEDETEAQFRERVGAFLPHLLAVRASKGARTALSCEAALGEDDGWITGALITGFEIASVRGPLCDEPVVDVHFIVESIEKKPSKDQASTSTSSQSISRHQLGGHMISAVRDACMDAMLRRSTARIAEPVLLLDLQCEGSSMGKVYGVLGKRRCQTLEEGFREGTSVFLLKIKLPMVESFNLSNEIRHVASGEVHYHARFFGFEMIEEDPFAEQARTQEDVEIEGDNLSEAATQNIPRKILTSVRRRKGLAIDERVVKDGTKQRNLTKMK